MLPASIACNTDIKNIKTENVKIDGNCEMCEATIETAGNKKNISKVDWDKNNKTAIIIFDSLRTNQSAILKRIANAGYDNEKFKAPNNVYEKLHDCCKYERKSETK